MPTLETPENLMVARDGPLAVVTLSRPKALNALDTATLIELREALLSLQQDDDIRCVVLTGAGEKAFAAGADIRELAAQSPIEAREYALRGQQVFDLIEHLGKPVIAAINGYALGGGCELAMACTIRLAADTARIGQPEVNLGLLPGFAGTQRLARLIGTGRALEMLLTGDHITAAEALRTGLVNRVVPAADLAAAARALASAIAAKPPVAVRYILEAVNRGTQQPLRDAQAFEATLFGLIASTEDVREGTAAFLDKRQPQFKGR